MVSLKHRVHQALLWVVISLAGCASGGALQPDWVRAVNTQSEGHVVVIKSGDNPLFDAPLRGFLETVHAKVTVYSLGENQSSLALANQIENIHPSMLFTLGSRATAMAKEYHPKIPVLFAMALNHRRLELDAKDNVAGIAAEVAPLHEFMQFRMLVPNLRRVLVFHSATHTSANMTALAKKLESVDIELVAAPAQNIAEVAQGYAAKHGQVDAIWYMNDPVLMQPQIFAHLRSLALGDRIPFLSSLSGAFAKGGALAAVSVDLRGLGSQAGALARQILRGELTAAQIGVRDPIGAELTVNEEVAAAIGLSIPVDVMPLVNHWVSSPAVPE